MLGVLRQQDDPGPGPVRRLAADGGAAPGPRPARRWPLPALLGDLRLCRLRDGVLADAATGGAGGDDGSDDESARPLARVTPGYDRGGWRRLPPPGARQPRPAHRAHLRCRGPGHPGGQRARPPAPAGVDLSAYRIIQEALTNVVKHAGTGARCAVSLCYTDADLVIRVTDDGGLPAQFPAVSVVGPRGRARNHRHAGAGAPVRRHVRRGAAAGRRVPGHRDAAAAGRQPRRGARPRRGKRRGRAAGPLTATHPTCRAPGRAPAAVTASSAPGRWPEGGFQVTPSRDRCPPAPGTAAAGDDHLRRGRRRPGPGPGRILRHRRRHAPGLTVVGEAANGAEAVAVARAAQPDVVLMDVRMPVLDGIEATRQITAAAESRRRPGASS